MNNAYGKNDVVKNVNFVNICNHDKIKKNVTFNAEGVLYSWRKENKSIYLKEFVR